MSAVTDIKKILSKTDNKFLIDLEPKERLDRLQELLPHHTRKNLSKSYLRIVNNCKQDNDTIQDTDTNKSKQYNDFNVADLDFGFADVDFSNDNDKLQDDITDLKKEIDTLKARVTALEQVSQSDQQQQTIVDNNTVADILKIDLVGTARETFYLTSQNRIKINDLYKELNVNKSKLVNYIIQQFFISV